MNVCIFSVLTAYLYITDRINIMGVSQTHLLGETSSLLVPAREKKNKLLLYFELLFSFAMTFKCKKVADKCGKCNTSLLQVHL